MAAIKKLYNDPTFPNPLCLVNSNQVTHHLLVNGQGRMSTKHKCPALPTVKGKPALVSAFSEEEYRKGIAALKNNKAAGIDDIDIDTHADTITILETKLTHKAKTAKVHNFTAVRTDIISPRTHNYHN